MSGPDRSKWLELGPLFLTVFICGLALSSRAVQAQEKLPANQVLARPPLSDFSLAGKSAAQATSRLVQVTGARGFDQALQVETRQRAANEYDIQLALPLAQVALKKGDIIWLGLQARMLSTHDESGQGILGIVIEQSKEPYSKLLQQRLSVGDAWQLIALPARINADFPAGSLHLTLRLGAAAQTLQIADVRLVRFDDPAAIRLADLPQTHMTYGGRDLNAAWRKTADERIDQIRKASLTVHVVDGSGKPIPGAIVSVKMQQHAFPFGCVYDPKEIAGPESQTAEARAYAEHFTSLFNVGVDEYSMKWPNWEHPQDREMAMAAVDWMRAHGIRVRGHCLVWPGWGHLPPDLRRLKGDPTALGRAVSDHIRDEVSSFAGKLTEWDVINEPYVNNDLMKALGYGVMADWFKVAHAADPKPRLLLNETSVPTNPPHDIHYDTLFAQVKAIQREGGPIGGVGMQAHFGSWLTSIDDLQRIYDRFSTLNIPIEITELDIDVSDEQLQADYLRDFLTFSFSHPDIDGIMLWGFVQGHHWRPDAALFRSDWSIKPNGQVWRDLVLGKWWTDVRGKTGGDGTYSTRGFLGEYEITATAGDRTRTIKAQLPKGGSVIEMKLP